MKHKISFVFLFVLLFFGFTSNSFASYYDLGDITLRDGSSGKHVMELQRFLNEKLNLGLVIDGKLGQKTIDVIKKWQQENNLVADGLVGSKTKLIINSSSDIKKQQVTSNVATSYYDLGDITLRDGSSGKHVMELQRFLNEKLNLGLVIDGKLGQKTIDVIKKWQQENNLVADGLVGSKTKLIINSSSDIKKQQVTSNVATSDLSKTPCNLISPDTSFIKDDFLDYVNNTSCGIKPGHQLITKSYKEGDIHIEIIRLKLFLNMIFFDTTPFTDADKMFDNNLKIRIKTFQKQQGLTETGEVDNVTRNFINSIAFQQQYQSFKDKLLNTPEWKRLSLTRPSIEVNTTDEKECGTYIAAGHVNACVLGIKITNASNENFAFINSINFLLEPSNIKSSLSNITMWDKYFSRGSVKATIKDDGATDFIFDQLLILAPGKSFEGVIRTTTFLNASGRFKISTVSYNTIFQKQQIAKLYKDLIIEPHENFGTFLVEVPEYIASQEKFKNNIIKSEQDSEVGVYRIINNLNDSIEPKKFTFKVVSNGNVPYDQLFSNIYSVDGNNKLKITVIPVSSDTFIVEFNNGGGHLMPGATSWYNLKVKPHKPGSEFRIDLINIETKSNQQASGFPVNGYYTFVE